MHAITYHSLLSLGRQAHTIGSNFMFKVSETVEREMKISGGSADGKVPGLAGKDTQGGNAQKQSGFIPDCPTARKANHSSVGA